MSKKAMNCPSCGASLALADVTGGDGRYAVCSYCGSTVPLTGPGQQGPGRPGTTGQPGTAGAPHVTFDGSHITVDTPNGRHLTVDMPAPVFTVSSSTTTTRPTSTTQIRVPTPGAGSRAVGCLVTLGILAAVIGVVVAAVPWNQLRTTLHLGSSGPAQQTKVFAGEGTGPGLLKDPERIAVDPKGNVWVADSSDGRIQEFTSTGTYVRTLRVPADPSSRTLSVSGLAVDGRNHLYVSRNGDVLALTASTGHLLWSRKGWDENAGNYEALAVDSDGVLFALNTTASDNELVRFGAGGKIAKRWVDIVTKVNPDDAAMDLDLTIDGLGEMYIVSSFGNQVYRYHANGVFVDRFGSEGNDPGQFSMPDRIEVDGQSRLYVPDSGDIDQFDQTGRYLGRIDVDYTQGSPRDMAFDRSGHLFTVTTSGKVVEYVLNAPTTP